MKSTPKTPNNTSVTKMAQIIVNKEVSRIVGPEGAMGLMKIGALLKLTQPLYQAYFDAVDHGEIHLEHVKAHFSTAAWASLTNSKRQLLAAAITKEVERVKNEIKHHMDYLISTGRSMETLSPKGQEALALVMQELTGEIG